MSKKQRIVEAARKRFQHYGIGKTTMQEIAADAGVAVGTLYLYFSNKDELVVACAEDFVDRHRQEAAAILADRAPAEDLLRRYVVARFRLAAELRGSSRHAAQLVRAVLRVKPDRIHEEGMMMWQVISEILKLGVARREFRIARPEDYARVFLYSIASFFPNALTNPPIEPREEDLLLVVNWFIKTWQSRRPIHSRTATGKNDRSPSRARRMRAS